MFTPGPVFDFPQNVIKPSEYFSLFYDKFITDLIAEETNRYASQFFGKFPEKIKGQYYRDWTEVTGVEIRAYLGLMLHMGITQYPLIKNHWDASEKYYCPICINSMTRNEFFRLQKFIHFNDNTHANQQDKIYKVRKLLNLLTERFRRYYILSYILTYLGTIR